MSLDAQMWGLAIQNILTAPVIPLGEKSCAVCGGLLFNKRPTVITKYCSPECKAVSKRNAEAERREALREAPSARFTKFAGVVSACEVCGSAYEPKMPHQKVCSVACRTKAATILKKAIKDAKENEYTEIVKARKSKRGPAFMAERPR